ncbi:hypothetical protein [Streptosporangium sp. NPDC051022]|uniref:hypothetical protein n=1 Tax=Streptosporangium sp. NPDC051022 TaxID=3155752 RepID=UPI0034371F3B
MQATAATHTSTASAAFRQPAIPSARVATTVRRAPAAVITAAKAPTQEGHPSRTRAVPQEARAGRTR